MKIYLVGMPGSGKSTVGKQLAAELSLPFIDLDHEIEKQEEKSIKEIFNQSGEEYFRKIESRVLQTLASSPENFVMATGGGAPCFHEGIQTINKSGLSIFLDVTVEELMSRVEKNTDRPLILSKDNQELKSKLETIRNQRLAHYEQAKIRVTDSNLKTVMDSLKL